MKLPFIFDAKISLTGEASHFGTDLFLALIGIGLIIFFAGIAKRLQKSSPISKNKLELFKRIG